jgi:hypothetical protein
MDTTVMTGEPVPAEVAPEYNIAAIPLAAAGFLNPVTAGAAMAAPAAFMAASRMQLRRPAPPTPSAVRAVATPCRARRSSRQQS